MFQLYQHINGVGSPIDTNSELTGVFKPNTNITLSIIGNTFTATGYNTVDSDTLFLQGTISPNSLWRSRHTLERNRSVWKQQRI